MSFLSAALKIVQSFNDFIQLKTTTQPAATTPPTTPCQKLKLSDNLKHKKRAKTPKIVYKLNVNMYKASR